MPRSRSGGQGAIRPVWRRSVRIFLGSEKRAWVRESAQVNRLRPRAPAGPGVPRAKLGSSLLEKPNKFITTVLLGNNIFAKHHFSRPPVYDGTLDNVVGTVTQNLSTETVFVHMKCQRVPTAVVRDKHKNISSRCRKAPSRCTAGILSKISTLTDRVGAVVLEMNSRRVRKVRLSPISRVK